MDRPPDIAVVIPAFNEARRLPQFLREVIDYCNDSKKNYEIIVVDDGSTDGTSDVASEYAARFPHLRTIRLSKNMGKGYAVKTGFQESRSEICLFLDADGSVAPDQIEKNLHYILEEGYDIFVGSRVLTGEDQVLKVKLYRKLMGGVFNLCVRTFLFDRVKDTQCGFKMFRRDVANVLVSNCHLRDYGFDMEMLYVAHKMGYKIKEAPVSWHHVGGSKVNLLTDSLDLFRNIFQIRKLHGPLDEPISRETGQVEFSRTNDE